MSKRKVFSGTSNEIVDNEKGIMHINVPVSPETAPFGYVSDDPKDKPQDQNVDILLEEMYPRWKAHTNVNCWWCCHPFVSVPLGLPIKYKAGKFTVKGVFCSFACVLAFNKKETSLETKSLIKLMYKKLTGTITVPDKASYKKALETKFKETPDYINAMLELSCQSMECAPDRYTLRMFGGPLDIETFRSASKENKVYRVLDYPFHVSRSYVESIDIKNVKNLNSRSTLTNLIDKTKIDQIRKNVNNTICSTNTMDKFIKYT